MPANAKENTMSILMLLLTLAVFGFILYLITTYIPMAPQIKTAIVVIATIALILWLISIFGLLGPMSQPIRPIR